MKEISRVHLLIKKLNANLTEYFYRPHPKDGEGNIFSLSTLTWRGGG